MRAASSVGNDQTIETCSPGSGSSASTGPALEPLIRDIAVRTLAAEVGDHRGLPVRLGGYFDSRKLCVSNDSAPSAPTTSRPESSRATVERHSHALLLDCERFAATAPPARGLARARPAARDPRRSRRARARRRDRRRTRARESPSSPYTRIACTGAALAEALSSAERRRKADVAGAERVDPGVEALPARRRDAALVRHERDRKAVRRARQACADRPAADDDQVVVREVYNDAHPLRTWRISSAG